MPEPTMPKTSINKVQCGIDHFMTILELGELWNSRYAYPTYRCGDYSTYPLILDDEEGYNATDEEILETVEVCPEHGLPVSVVE